MARRAEGYKVRQHKSGTYYIRFTLDGERYDLSLGTRDKAAAYREAPKVYARYVARGPVQPNGLTSGATIVDAGAEWLASVGSALDPLTVETYERYLTVFERYFGTIDQIPKRAEAFMYDRLKKVGRETVKKELSGLRGLVRHALGDAAARTVPTPPRTAVGKVVFDRRVTELDPKVTRKVLAALKGPAREYFTVLYETGLRPATLYELRVPDHYTPGAKSLRITDEIDKARFGRDLPLTPAARRALDLACPDGPGLIFGQHDYRYPLEKACALVAASRCTPYDLRHAFGTHMVERSNNLPGVAYLMGHRNTGTTSARYVHPSRRAALDVLGTPEYPSKRGRVTSKDASRRERTKKKPGKGEGARA